MPTASDDINAQDEALLATLGYKQEFKRAFTPFEVFGVAFSIIGLLPSIASVLLFALPNGGGPSMVWGWLTASVFLMSIAVAMAELASAAPTSGGLYFWTYSLSTPRWRNLLCWLVGYANTIGMVAGLASIDWGCAVQVMAAATISTNGVFQPTPAQLFGVYVAIVVSHGCLCSLGTAVLARLQSVYIVLNILLCLAVIIGLPAATPSEFRNSAQVALVDFTDVTGWSNGYAFFLSFLAPLWTICSFDSGVHISEEASNAATAVPWAIVSAVAVAGVLGFAINMALAFCMGSNLELLVNSSQPMAQIFLNSFGLKPTLAIWAVVIIVQYMMGSSILLAGSRQIFAFSRDRALPFSGFLYRINRYTQTPVNTVWFDVILAILLGCLVFAGTQAINAVFALSVTSLYVAYSIPISARIVTKTNFKPGPFSIGIWSIPVAFVAVVFMVFMTIVFLFPMTPQTSVQNMNYTVAVLGGVLLLSLVWYYFPKYGGVHWFTGPVANVNTTRSPSLNKTRSIDSEKAGIA